MRASPRAFQIDPDHAISTISLGISVYQSYENRRTLKLLKRIHKYGFVQNLKNKGVVRLDGSSLSRRGKTIDRENGSNRLLWCRGNHSRKCK